MGAPPDAVAAYLTALDTDQRDALNHLAEVIRRAVPEAVESLNYGVPAFKYRGRPLVSYGATKNHCAFYVQSPGVMVTHADALAGYDTSKGTVRFQPDRPLSDDLVKTLVRARVAEIESSTGR
jgi:uncharacterized protein YdhG (YjbR/CyaY superfamily)